MTRNVSLWATGLVVGIATMTVQAQHLNPRFIEPGAKITNLLEQHLLRVSPTELTPVYARFDLLPDMEQELSFVQGLSKADRRAYAIELLKGNAEVSQVNVQGFLETQERMGRARVSHKIWLNNTLAFEATADVIRAVSEFSEVRYVNIDRVFATDEVQDSAAPSTPLPRSESAGVLPPTSNLNKINAPQAWARGHTGTGVLVAIVDSGVNYNHPDLVDHRWTNPDEINGNGIDDDGNGYIDDFIGWDFGGANDNNPIDTGSSSHGTAVAGIVCGDGTQGTETGVAPNATFMVLRIEGASESEWWAAYQYAVAEGADVVDSSYSLKWPSNPDYNSFRDATNSELLAGVIHANSVGNQGGLASHPIPFNISTPGNCPPPWLHPDQSAPVGTNSHVSAVMGCGDLSSSSSYETISSSSGRGPAAWSQCDADLTFGGVYPSPFAPYNDYPVAAGCSGVGGLLKPDVCAPGTSTSSLRNSYLTGGSHYGSFGGTSGATPHLGGLMCLILDANPNLSPEQVCQIIQLTATQSTGDPSAAKDNLYGAGRIDCLAAVIAAETAGAGNLRLLITEVSWGDPDYLEIHNFTTAPIDLTGWTIQWKDGSTQTSTAGGGMIQPGATFVYVETGGTITQTPAPTTVRNLSFGIGTTSGDFAVALIDPSGFVVDEVHVASTTGAYAEGSLGGLFRGVATRGATSTTGGQSNVERIWGLDSDGGTDWTEQTLRSAGYESRSSGPRGTDTATLNNFIRINEVDDSPDYIELRSTGLSQICLLPPFSGCIPLFTNLKDWYLVIGDDLVPGSRTVVRPFNDDTLLQGGSYLVIGDSSTPPAELPSGVTYIDVTANIPFASREFSIVLYDNLGRVVDAVRATSTDRNVVYNHPRMPTHWADFTGAVFRTAAGDGCIGRDGASTDTGTGADWRAISTRTMGFANSGFTPGFGGHGDILDVRGNEGPNPGNGATVIINAGSGAAGWSYGQILSFTHSGGTGPFLGLGADAPTNFTNLFGIAPYFGVLDAEGSGRYDFAPGSIPAGITIDAIFYITNGSSFRLTQVVEFDT